ncbi:MAG: hypothetical protein C0410_05160 [Anaerolinea sp.]|nr:hypothetical protein [Anaerolinea sp.]
MNIHEGLKFIRGYFDDLFVKRNIEALDKYLDKTYFDEDIGDPSVDHIQNSKEFLKDLFIRVPTIGVEVIDAVCHDDVLTAYLEWYRMDSDTRQLIRKGVAIFVMNGKQIVKRHTFIYETR